MSSGTFDNYLHTGNTGTIGKLDILSNLGKLHAISSIMDAPAPGGIAKREHDIMLPAECEYLVEMLDKRVFALVHEHERTGNGTAL
jgi:hypothetical protein